LFSVLAAFLLRVEIHRCGPRRCDRVIRSLFNKSRLDAAIRSIAAAGAIGLYLLDSALLMYSNEFCSCDIAAVGLCGRIAAHPARLAGVPANPLTRTFPYFGFAGRA